eukprot:2683003-Rhodomonas_salina.1
MWTGNVHAKTSQDSEYKLRLKASTPHKSKTGSGERFRLILVKHSAHFDQHSQPSWLTQRQMKAADPQSPHSTMRYYGDMRGEMGGWALTLREVPNVGEHCEVRW